MTSKRIFWMHVLLALYDMFLYCRFWYFKNKLVNTLTFLSMKIEIVFGGTIDEVRKRASWERKLQAMCKGFTFNVIHDCNNNPIDLANVFTMSKQLWNMSTSFSWWLCRVDLMSLRDHCIVFDHRVEFILQRLCYSWGSSRLLGSIIYQVRASLLAADGNLECWWKGAFYNIFLLM